MYRESAKGWMKHIDFIAIDLICLQVAFCIAYVIRHGFANPYAQPLYRNMAFVLLLIDSAVIFFGNAYSNATRRGLIKEAGRVISQTLLITGVSALYLFTVQQGGEYSRITMYLTMTIYAALLLVCRQIRKKRRAKRNRRGEDAMLVAVTANRADEVVCDLLDDESREVNLSGIVIMDDPERRETDPPVRTSYRGVPVVATERGLIDYICHAWVDEILFASPNAKLVDEIVESGIAVHVILGRAESRVGKKQVIESMGGYTVMTTITNYVTVQQAFLKRVFDILGGLVGSVAALIALIIVGPIIYIQSQGPSLFKQVRVGRNGRRFNFLKIRSMVVNADAMKKDLMDQNRVKDGMIFKLDFDPRIIGAKKLPDGRIKRGIGNFIRDWSIDELPQFFNVLKGDMSLVGTRPPTVDEWEKYQLHHRARLAFKPGITGLWQTSGRSNITDFEEVVRLDTKYINEWDFGLDCKILAETVKAVLEKTGSM